MGGSGCMGKLLRLGTVPNLTIAGGCQQDRLGRMFGRFTHKLTWAQLVAL